MANNSVKCIRQIAVNLVALSPTATRTHVPPRVGGNGGESPESELINEKGFWVWPDKNNQKGWDKLDWAGEWRDEVSRLSSSSALPVKEG